MDQQERQLVIDRLNENRERALAAVSGLSPNQLTFQSADKHWSVADCFEHIVIVEDLTLNRIQQVLTEPPEPEKRAAVEGKLAKLLRAVPDRSTKFAGPSRVMPHGHGESFDEVVERFKVARERTIAFAATAGDELHDHFFPHPVFKELDCYQWLILIGLHSERHILQIEEVKASPGFPR